MKSIKLYACFRLFCIILTAASFAACKKDGNPNNLPDVSPKDYEGTVNGYHSADEVYADRLVAYWSFEGTKDEQLSGTAPTSSAGDSYMPDGVKGQALSLNAGYVYYGTPFPLFKTDTFKSFTISTWVQILNNGSKMTMLFQLARPGMLTGNINFVLETNAKPASDLDNLIIHPTFTAKSGGTQDNLNATWEASYKSPKIGADKWTHILLTYNGATGTFNIWADGEEIGNYPDRGVGDNLFNSYEPNEVIFGSNYNAIPGKEINADANFAPMTGNIDEIRIYNIALPAAQIKALYNLGLVNK